MQTDQVIYKFRLCRGRTPPRLQLELTSSSSEVFHPSILSHEHSFTRAFGSVGVFTLNTCGRTALATTVAVSAPSTPEWYANSGEAKEATHARNTFPAGECELQAADGNAQAQEGRVAAPRPQQGNPEGNDQVLTYTFVLSPRGRDGAENCPAVAMVAARLFSVRRSYIVRGLASLFTFGG